MAETPISGAKFEDGEVPDHFTEFNSFLQTTKDENERGMALTLAAFMEDSLGKVLLTFMRDTESAKLLVAGVDVPLGTFSSRSKAYHALGLISDVQFADVERLRKIRNRFAHNWEVTSLSHDQVANLAKAMSPSRIETKVIEGDLVWHFQSSCICVLIELQVQITKLQESGRTKLRPLHLQTTPP